MIRNGAVTNDKIEAIKVDKLLAGSIGVSQYIGSPDYVAGQSGWRINGDGTAEFSNVTVRGEIIATSGEIESMSITGSLVSNDDGERRIYIPGGYATILFDTAHASQDRNGYITGFEYDKFESDALATVVAAPSYSEDGAMLLWLESETEDDSTAAPRLHISYTGSSTQTPVVSLGYEMALSAYSAYATTTASAANLYVENGSGDVDSYTFKRSTSSLAYKTNVEPFTNGLDTIRALEPIRYTSKADGDDPDRTFVGLGAEPTAAVFPEADQGDNYDVKAVLAALVAAVKELDQR